jgi:hypothetical protein
MTEISPVIRNKMKIRLLMKEVTVRLIKLSHDRFWRCQRGKLRQFSLWKCAEMVQVGAKCKFCGKLFKINDGNNKSITRHITAEGPEFPVVPPNMRSVKSSCNFCEIHA